MRRTKLPRMSRPHRAPGGASPLRRPQRGAAALLVGAHALGACRAAPAESTAFRTASVERRDLVATVEVTGYLEARTPRVVTAPRPGRLVDVRVTAGSTVAAGDVLAHLEAEPSKLAVRRQRALVAAADARVDEAEARHRETRQALDRARTLRGRGQLSEAELEEAVGAEAKADAAVRVARAELDRARQDLAQARLDLEQTDISAPADGVVLSAPDELGIAVDVDGPQLFRLAEPLDALQLLAEVGEADIARLAPGQPVRFEVQAFPGEWFPAEIERIGVLGRREQGVATYTVELTAPNPDGRLRPGMTAAIRFEVGRATDALVVREAAVRFVPEGAPEAPPRSRVFRLTGPRAVEIVPIEVGISDGAFTVVRPRADAVLEVGDRVVIGAEAGAGDEVETNISLGGGGA